MKVDARQVEALLRDPGPVRAVLLYGEDAGLIAERARRLVRAAAGTLDDPFRVVDLPRESVKRLAEEMAGLALTGGRRVVRVREAGDAATAPLEAALGAAGSALAVLEAPGLPASSRLRRLVERAEGAAAIACYPLDGAALTREVKAGLQARGVSADAAALAWLGRRLGSDWAGIQAELDKLALYVGPGGTVDAAAAEACTGDLAGLSLEGAVLAATAGDASAADQALETAFAAGATAVGALRAGLGHVLRLQLARQAMSGGISAAGAAKSLRPPVFFRQEEAFVRALERWPEDRLAAIAAALFAAESACKRTGAPADTIARRAILALSGTGRGG